MTVNSTLDHFLLFGLDGGCLFLFVCLALAILEPTMHVDQASLNLTEIHLSLSGIKGICHHTQQILVFKDNGKKAKVFGL